MTMLLEFYGLEGGISARCKRLKIRNLIKMAQNFDKKFIPEKWGLAQNGSVALDIPCSLTTAVGK